MSMFTYNRDIPDGPNNPSNDQPKMKTNTNSTDDILAVDHVSFNDTPGGTHLQTTYSSKNAAGAQVDPQSVVYTGNGTASTVAQLFFRNQNRIFHLSPIRAWGYCNIAGVTNNQSFNVVSVKRKMGALVGRFTVTLTTDSVSSADYAIIVSSSVVSSSLGTQCGMQYISQYVFDLNFLKLDGSAYEDPGNFNFMVLQI